MLNEVLTRHLPPELNLLYRSKMLITNSDIRNRISSAAKALREAYREHHSDPLMMKQLKYPNTGDWYRAKIKAFRHLLG